MASLEITWTVPGQSHADVIADYDPGSVDANGNVAVTSASGTYQVLDGGGNVVRTDQITGLIPANSFIFAPDDEVNVAGKDPFVDTAGLGVIIDNAADADNIGPNNTPQVVFSTDIFGDYRELSRGDATDVTIGPGGGSGSGSGGSGSGSGGGTSGSGVTVTTKPNGRHRVDIAASDQTVASNYYDTFHNNGAPGTTFVFDPGFGHDAITLFRLGGADHDTLDLPSSDFASIADVLRHTSKAAGGAVIHDPTSGDAIKIAGVSKAQLAHHRQDFALHG